MICRLTPEGDENTCVQYGQVCFVAREIVRLIDNAIYNDSPCLFRCFCRSDFDWNCWAHLSHWKFEETERKRTFGWVLVTVKDVYHPLIVDSARWTWLRRRTMIHNVDKRWFSLVYVDECALEFDTLYLDDECNLEALRTKTNQLEATRMRKSTSCDYLPRIVVLQLIAISKHCRRDVNSSIKSGMISIASSPIILIFSSSLLQFATKTQSWKPLLLWSSSPVLLAQWPPMLAHNSCNKSSNKDKSLLNLSWDNFNNKSSNSSNKLSVNSPPSLARSAVWRLTSAVLLIKSNPLSVDSSTKCSFNSSVASKDSSVVCSHLTLSAHFYINVCRSCFDRFRCHLQRIPLGNPRNRRQPRPTHPQPRIERCNWWTR